MIHGPLPHRTSSPNHRSRPSRKSRRFEPMKNSWALFFLGSKHDVILSLSKSERSAEDQALLMFCAITRGQWFNDGNTRTALMAANHVLINAGIGVFAISPSLKRDFTNRLLRYYESDDPAPLCAWLRDYAIGRLPGGLTSAESRRLETERIKSGRPSIGLPIPNPTAITEDTDNDVRSSMGM